MKTVKPKEITTSTLLQFLKAQELCVLRVRTRVEPELNIILILLFEQSYPNDTINFGWIDLRKIDSNDVTVNKIISRCLK